MLLSSIYNPKIIKFDHVISLGQSCMVAYQIKRYFGINHSYLFDCKYTYIETAIRTIYFCNHTYNESLALKDKEYQEKRFKAKEIWKGSDLVRDRHLQEQLFVNKDY